MDHFTSLAFAGQNLPFLAQKIALRSANPSQFPAAFLENKYMRHLCQLSFGLPNVDRSLHHIHHNSSISIWSSETGPHVCGAQYAPCQMTKVFPLELKWRT